MDNSEKTRSPLLSALCILTFIGSGLAFAGYLLSALFFDKATELIVHYSTKHSVDDISPLYFAFLMALSAISLSGAIRMWKFRRDGFYFYLASQTAMLFLPVFWMGWPAFSDTNAIFTLIFFIGYWFCRKELK